MSWPAASVMNDRGAKAVTVPCRSRGNVDGGRTAKQAEQTAAGMEGNSK